MQFLFVIKNRGIYRSIQLRLIKSLIAFAFNLYQWKKVILLYIIYVYMHTYYNKHTINNKAFLVHNLDQQNWNHLFILLFTKNIIMEFCYHLQLNTLDIWRFIPYQQDNNRCIYYIYKLSCLEIKLMNVFKRMLSNNDSLFSRIVHFETYTYCINVDGNQRFFQFVLNFTEQNKFIQF